MVNVSVAPINIIDTDWNALNCLSKPIGQIIYTKVKPVGNGLTIITSFFCAIVFWRILRNENQEQSGQMFKYLFVSSFVEVVFTCFWFIDSFVDAPFVTFATSIYLKYFDNFLALSLVFISNWLELAATIDCYLKINDKLKSFTTKASFIIITSMITLCGLVNSIWVQFRFNYVSITFNITTNETKKIRYYYTAKVTSFFNTPLDTGLRILVNTTRELVPIILIIIINILILKTLVNVMKRKREMIKIGNNNTATSDADINKLKMIIAMSLNYVLLRSIYLHFQLGLFSSKTVGESCVWLTGLILYHFSYLLKFIIFYYFNKLFRKHFKFLFTKCQ
jgi:hypothetical protein